MQSFDVTGMTCDHCVSSVKAAIAIADPDATVDVDLAAGKVLVTNDTAPEDVLLQAIEAEGYGATPTAPPP